MGINALSYVSDKVTDDEFKRELSTQYNQYEDILTRVTDLYNDYGEVPANSNFKDDMMTWMGVQMNTINDKTPSKLSELLIQGNTMGIIEGRRLINNNPAVEASIKQTLNDFVTLQENTITKLKEYL
ncbi:MAG: hypothetical protein HFJ19_03025 [Clostridia bacterium]|nr:hypothetical protein [Clostridia bacterium]